MLVAGMDDTGWWYDEGVWRGVRRRSDALCCRFLRGELMGVWQGLAARNSMRASRNTMGLVLFAPGRWRSLCWD
jgi:hypothetical protein